MRIDSIKINNFLGVKKAEIALTKQVVLIAGNNGSGKTSTIEALRMALLGIPARVDLKKDYDKIVYEGENNGAVLVAHSHGESSVSIPSGAITGAMHSRGLEACLRPEKFALMDEKEKRSFLFSLTGTKITVDAIEEKLHEIGAEKSKVDEIKALFVSGFEAAHREAKEQATQEKGAWRKITNETYGAQKAKTWTAPKKSSLIIPLDSEQIALKRALYDEALSMQNKLNTELTQKEAMVSQSKSIKAQADDLLKKSENIERIKEKLNIDIADVEKWQKSYDDLQQKMPGTQKRNLFSCPHCNGKIEYTKDGYVPWHETETREATQEEIDKLALFARSLEICTNAVKNGREQLKQAEQSKCSAEALLNSISEKTPTPREIEDLANVLKQVTKEVQEKKQSVDEAVRNAELEKEEARKTKEAMTAHKNVLAWELIAEALSPSGIPNMFLSKAVDPFNSTLEQISKTSGFWPKVEIDKETMQLSYGGRDLSLCSESEQWRANAMIAIAIAMQTGHKIVFLDGFDVIQPSGRGALFNMLFELTENGDLTQAIVAGTLKERPSHTKMQCLWAEISIVQ